MNTAIIPVELGTLLGRALERLKFQVIYEKEFNYSHVIALNASLPGHADFPKFESKPGGDEPESYLIEWTVRSTSPVTKFALKWRDGESGTWEHIDVTPTQINRDVYAGKWSLKGLRAATRYEAKVSSHNEWGWSRSSDTFHFSTFGAGLYQ